MNRANVQVLPAVKPAAKEDGTATEEHRLEGIIREMLVHLGEDPSREGLLRTPHRVEKAMKFLTSGYAMDLEKVVNGALFSVKYDEMVIVKDIEFFSLCEHHMLPFFGKMHIAYLPKQKVIGLSKIPRIVDVYARRLQIQERLTQEVAQAVQNLIEPLGVGVVCEARHFCMMMRGVEKQHSGAITSAMLGAFRTRKKTRDEFLSLVNHRISTM
jgi:GTP cyclohydrolase I